jgi:hypothetical protein
VLVLILQLKFYNFLQTFMLNLSQLGRSFKIGLIVSRIKQIIKFTYIRPFSQIGLVRVEFNLHTLTKIPHN